MKSAFLLSKGLLCLYDKQNNTWLHVDMEFFFSCSTRHLTRSPCSLASYRIKHLKRNSIYTRPCIILYLTHTHSCYQEKIIILSIVFSLVVMDLSDPFWKIRDKIVVNLASYNLCKIRTLFKLLLCLICRGCFSKLLFVFLILSSLMDLQWWWTEANLKWVEYVSWRGMLSVRIGRNHCEKKWLPPKCYIFSNRSLQHWQFETWLVFKHSHNRFNPSNPILWTIFFYIAASYKQSGRDIPYL